MKILISGDSWGKGEWDFVNGLYENTHEGLEFYLKKSNNQVYNISQGASCQNTVINKFKTIQEDSFFEYWKEKHLNLTHIPKLETYDYIFVFVTDLFRGSDLFERYWIVNNSRENILRELNKLKHDYLKNLNSFNVKIHLLGGLNKVTEDDVKNYKNIEIAIPSVIEFLLPDFEAYEVFFNDALNSLYSSIPDDLDPDYLDYVYNEVKKRDLLKTREYFSSDGLHPNREGHRLIFEEINRKYLGN
jgi:hypothetical protein